MPRDLSRTGQKRHFLSTYRRASGSTRIGPRQIAWLPASSGGGNPRWTLERLQAGENQQPVRHAHRVMTATMPTLVYFSSSSENTHRFIGKLALPALRIPLATTQRLQLDRPYILVTPSYGGGSEHGTVPPQVIRFLNDATNRFWLRGVIGAGNRNFGAAFCLAADVIANKCQVPLLYRFELLGTEEDVKRVIAGVTQFWQRQQ